MFNFGRGGEIRTHGLLYPKQARYQTAPRPDNMLIIVNSFQFVNSKIKNLSLRHHTDVAYIKCFGDGRNSVPQDKGAVQFAFCYDQAAFAGYINVMDAVDKPVEFGIAQFFPQHFQAGHQLGLFLGKTFFNRG